MRPDLLAELKQLRLYGMAGAWSELVEQGQGPVGLDTSRWLLEHLVQAEHADRAMRSVRHQLNLARFPLHRDLAPAPRRTAEVDHPRARHEKPELVVDFEDLVGRPAPIAFGLGLFHIRIVELAFEPEGRRQFPPAGRLHLHVQVALPAARRAFRPFAFHHAPFSRRPRTYKRG